MAGKEDFALIAIIQLGPIECGNKYDFLFLLKVNYKNRVTE